MNAAEVMSLFPIRSKQYSGRRVCRDLIYTDVKFNKLVIYSSPSHENEGSIRYVVRPNDLTSRMF